MLQNNTQLKSFIDKLWNNFWSYRRGTCPHVPLLGGHYKNEIITNSIIKQLK